MMTDPSPLMRQWKMLLALANHEAGLGVHELSHEHEVTEKTIRRDLILLRRAGFPLEESVIAHGRKLWRLVGAKLALDLNWQEAFSLHIALRFLEPLAGTYFVESAHQAFSKIQAGLGKQATQYLDRMIGKLHLTATGVGRLSDKAVHLDQLTRAIEECRICLLTYQSERSTEPVTREIHPYAWVFHRQSPYLVAFATEHREVRLYKADRIHDVHVNTLKFPRPADFDPEEYLAGSFGIYRGRKRRPLTIRVRFLPPVVQYVSEKQWHPSQKLSPQPDGNLLAEFRLGATEEIQRWLLSFGRNAEVLEPAELVADMRAEIEQMQKAYVTPRPSAATKKRNKI